MVHAKAAVTPSSGKVMEEAIPEYTSLANVHEVEEDSVVVTTSRPKSHRRHNSLFSNASAPVDLSDYPSMKESSSTTETGLRKSTSGNFNWKFGEFLSKFRGSSAKPTTSRTTSLTLDTTSKSATPPLGFQKVEENPDPLGLRKPVENPDTLAFQKVDDRKPPLAQNERKKGKDPADPVSPTSKSKSLHFTSLSLFSSSKFSSSKFSSSSDLDANPSSPLDQSGQLESSEDQTLLPLSTKWREIQGLNYWHGLLDPLDLDLRKEILRYGEFAELAYENYECSAHSRYAGSARHSKQKFFPNLHKSSCGYHVTRYLYATSEHPLPGVLLSSFSEQSWDRDSNWMGYVAVANDPEEIERLGRRDIVVAWRGAVRTLDWLVDAQTQMTPIRVEQSSKASEVVRPKVEKGFWSLFTCRRPGSQFNRASASEQVIAEIRRLLILFKGENLSITLTGHNLGGALAILTAYEIAERGLVTTATTNPSSEVTMTVITFGAPHVGDGHFRRRVEELQLRILRVANLHDVVPKNIANFYPLWGSSDASKHVGVELQVNHKLSPYLRPALRDPLDWHNLECYLHLVDGYQGPKAKTFELVTGRDVALVNKFADVLLAKLCVPGLWWQAENKGLVLGSEGRWVEPARAPLDAPSLANRERFV